MDRTPALSAQVSSAELLSAEVLETVLRHLSLYGLLSARCVCRRWRDVAESIIKRRAARDGPFMLLLQSDVVPEHCTLPLFMSLDARQITHGSVAQCSLYDVEEAPLIGPAALRKLARLGVSREWPAALLCSDAMPRLRRLQIGVHVPLPLEPDCLSRVTSVQLTTAKDEAFARATPHCKALHIGDCPASHVDACVALWPALEALHVEYGHVCVFNLPRHLKTLELSYSENLDALAWGGRPPVIEFPCLRELQIECTTGLSVRLRAPALRKLELHTQAFDVVDTTALPLLQEVRLSCLNRDVANLGFLGTGLRHLTLYEVRVSNLDFLERTTHLQELSLVDVSGPACAMPCATLTRLRDLTVHGSILEITNWHDFRFLCSVETLHLRRLAYVTELSWMAGLDRVTLLQCQEMPNLSSVRGIQDAWHLQEVELGPAPALRNVSYVSVCERLRRLRLRYLNVESLDLGASPVRTVQLHHVVCREAPVLPAGLRCVVLETCSFPAPTAQCLAPLRALRRLTFTAVQETLDLQALAARNPLRQVEVSVDALRSDPGAKISAEIMTLKLRATAGLAPGSVSAASLRLELTLGLGQTSPTSNLELLDTSVLRSLFLTVRCGRDSPSLAPLRACHGLWCLSIDAGQASIALDGLSGHAALREVHLWGFGQPVDVSALLTCPRLVVVSLRNVDVHHAQRHALMQHIHAVRAVDTV